MCRRAINLSIRRLKRAYKPPELIYKMRGRYESPALRIRTMNPKPYLTWCE